MSRRLLIANGSEAGPKLLDFPKPKKKRKKNDENDNNTVAVAKLITYVGHHIDKVPVIELASAGFSYVNSEGGLITCTYCGLRFSAKFRQYFDPLAFHYQRSRGKCLFLKQLEDSRRPEKSHIDGAAVARCPASESSVLTVNGSNEVSSDRCENSQQTYLKYAQRNTEMKLDNISKAEKDLSKDIKVEAARRKTFSNSSLYADPMMRDQLWDMAADGLYLKSPSIRGEMMCCAFCNFTIPLSRDTCESVFVTQEHQSHSLCCPMLTGLVRQQVNVPDVLNTACWGWKPSPPTVDTTHLGIRSQLAKFPEFAVAERRLQTLLSYPQKLMIEKLCQAGYFFQGGANGAVTCFYCGCVSANWRTNEDPFQRHARTSGKCQFIVQEKGREYVGSVVEEFGVYREGEPEDKISMVTTRMMRPRWDSDVVQKALKMGLDRDDVKVVVGNKIKKGEQDFRYLTEIVMAINKQKVTGPPQTPEAACWLPDVTTDSSENESDTERSLAGNEMVRVGEVEVDEVEVDGVNRDEPQTTESQPVRIESHSDIRQTAQNLLSELLCKICLSDIIKEIFLPCGHFVCCTSCAAAMTNCPLCRQEITATIQGNFNKL